MNLITSLIPASAIRKAFANHPAADGKDNAAAVVAHAKESQLLDPVQLGTLAGLISFGYDVDGVAMVKNTFTAGLSYNDSPITFSTLNAAGLLSDAELATIQRAAPSN